MASVRFEAVTKRFGDVTAVHEMDLTIRDGEFLVLVGPSGCGKTTALRMIAGLERPTGGTLWIGDEDVTDLDPGDRDIGMVFQSYALYPQMTVYDNLAFGLRRHRSSRTQVDERVRAVAEILGLDTLLSRKPGQLSGGQRQRVALGRALARRPRVFLMDEPLSNLDAQLRLTTRAELLRLHRQVQTTTVYVTHDQVEAMTMGSRIVVMNAGRIQQVDTPQRVYDEPANVFVARFIGSPPMNLITGELSDNGRHFRSGSLDIELPFRHAAPSARVQLGIRPEHFRLDDDTPDSVISGTVDLVEPLGSDLLLTVTLHDLSVIARIEPTSAVVVGQTVHLAAPLTRASLFDATTGERIPHLDTGPRTPDLGPVSGVGASIVVGH